MKISKSDFLIRFGGDEFLLFSDTFYDFSENKLFTTGWSKIVSSIEFSINEADKMMIKNKTM
jgi:GGDEF domain-containing protein